MVADRFQGFGKNPVYLDTTYNQCKQKRSLSFDVDRRSTILYLNIEE